jgi:predicted nuclease of predicted toxin-antitoxin system
MRVLVDENIPEITVDELRKLGHDVLEIHGTPEQGMADDLVWDKAQAELRLLISTDKGFVSYRDVPHCGVLVVRLRQPNEQKIHARVMRAMGRYQEHEWPGLLVVMRDTVQSVWRAKEQS